MALPTYPLLAHCARAHCAPEHYCHLTQAASQCTAWSGISTQAEEHGLGPLLYTHLQAAGVSPPLPIKRELQGLYLRHRHANQARAQVLAEILAAYDAAGIQALVLKGAALAYLVYSHPGLRPMRDLDILVKKSEARRAQSLLAELGFNAPLPSAQKLPGKHLSAASRKMAGCSISVEVHHDLFNEDFPLSLELETLTGAPLAFTLNGQTAYTLGYEEMLWHLCQHVILLGQPLRLIWVADIVGFAERFVNEIDWRRIERRYPLILSTLSLFHFITPLSNNLLEQAPLRIGRPPQGIGLEFQGWPRSSLAAQRAKGYRRILLDTFFPSEWWLRLYYGLGSAQSLFWYRWIKHPLRILGWGGQLLLKRIGRSAARWN